MDSVVNAFNLYVGEKQLLLDELKDLSTNEQVLRFIAERVINTEAKINHLTRQLEILSSTVDVILNQVRINYKYK